MSKTNDSDEPDLIHTIGYLSSVLELIHEDLAGIKDDIHSMRELLERNGTGTTLEEAVRKLNELEP